MIRPSHKIWFEIEEENSFDSKVVSHAVQRILKLWNKNTLIEQRRYAWMLNYFRSSVHAIQLLTIMMKILVFSLLVDIPIAPRTTLFERWNLLSLTLFVLLQCCVWSEFEILWCCMARFYNTQTPSYALFLT